MYAQAETAESGRNKINTLPIPSICFTIFLLYPSLDESVLLLHVSRPIVGVMRPGFQLGKPTWRP